jgi:L-threonylcarbamoyladenylate synthase
LAVGAVCLCANKRKFCAFTYKWLWNDRNSLWKNMTEIVQTSNWSDALSRAVRALARGELVAIPTETVYGLAADAKNGEAVARIFQTKGRPEFNPLICHVDGMVMAEQYGILPEAAHRLAARFWPGPLTLVVTARKDSGLSGLVTAGLDTVGLRCPKGIAREIISALGRPLAAPSANRSGRISPTSAEHVAAEFSKSGNENPLLVVDGGPCPVGLESTIVKISGDRLTLLRPGAIGVAEIEEASGLKIELPTASSSIEAPGMMASHYAPDAKVCLNRETCGNGEAWLGFGNREAPDNAAMALNLSPSSSLVEAAANLYDYLKRLDASGADVINVAPIPDEDLGIAINDRLRRASAPRPGQAG